MNIEFRDGFNLIHNTFQQSTIQDFRHFMAPFNDLGVTKWIIFSDYCIDDPHKLYNALTFTIVPYVDEFDILKQFVGDIAPDDLKRIKRIDERFGQFIKSGYLFNLAIVYEKGKNHVFARSTKEKLSEELKQMTHVLREWMVNTPQNKAYFESVIKKINVLRNELMRKTFNLRLLQNIVMIHSIVSYLLLILTKESSLKPEIIGWFSDRDDINTAYRGIIYDFVAFNYHNLCVAANISAKESTLAYVQQDLKSKQLWYDELIRIPDFLSGALAGRNYVSSIKDKYDQLFETAISDNRYLSVIGIATEDGRDQVARIMFHKQ